MTYLPDRETELLFAAELAKGRATKPIIVAGVDEVGRGAIAGPATVGIALIGRETSMDFPNGLKDSKMLSPKARENLVKPCKNWVLGHAVGHASAQIVNEYGIIGALRFAAAHALEVLVEQGYQISGVLLDGKHDWWSSNELFPLGVDLPSVPVQMVIKGDARCAVIAAASVLAKVERDTVMQELHKKFPAYNWAQNKGYASGEHIRALQEHGVSEYHRTAWKLPV